MRGPEGNKIAVRFTLKVSNKGESGRSEETPVEATINGVDQVAVTDIPALGVGEETILVFDLRLDPGEQQLKLRVDESDSLVVLDLLVSDVVISPISYQVLADELLAIRVKLTNEGTLPSRPVQLIALNNVVATVQPLEPGASEDVTFNITLPKGKHPVEVTASADESEANLSNNTATFDVEVDYVALNVKAGQKTLVRFVRGGSAELDVGYSVANIGVANSGNFVVAVACPDAEVGECIGEEAIENLAPGAEITGTIRAVVPQGISSIVLYAGENDDGYLWGDQNAVPATVDVPLQPDIVPVFAADATLNGYYSDGEASANVTVSLRNDGAEPIPGEYSIAVSCHSEGETISGCGGIVVLNLLDGYGPVEGIADIRVPHGEIELRVEGPEVAGTGKVLATSVNLPVPQRIVGVGRDTWKCFSDVSASLDFPRGNCSGRSSDVVQKWSQDRPVTVWINGLSAYSESFQDMLQELAPKLNFDYQLVAEERRADIAAYVGISDENVRTLGFTNCDGFWGCTSYQTNEENEIISAEIVIFEIETTKLRKLRLINETIESAMLHGLLQTLVPLGYRDVPDSIMSIDTGLRFPEMTESDEEIIRILTHPLVQTGHQTSDIEAMIVFADEILDPAEPPAETNLDIIERARLKLHDDESALYNMSGEWSGGTCIDRFGPSQVTISKFAAHRGLFYRLTDASEGIYAFWRSEDGRAEYWERTARTWRRFTALDEQELVDDTSWAPQYSDPLVLLVSTLYFGSETLVEDARTEESVDFRVSLPRAYAAPEWTDDASLSATFTIDLETYEVTRFAMTWEFDVRGLACDEYSVNANLIEYGSSLVIPSEIRSGSRVVGN